MTRAALADKLGVCKHTIREYERRGFLKPLRLSRRTIRYHVADVAAMERRLTIGGSR